MPSQDLDPPWPPGRTALVRGLLPAILAALAASCGPPRDQGASIGSVATRAISPDPSPLDHSPASASRGLNAARAPGPIAFRDVSAESGVSFRHTSGNSPEKEFPTCLGSGVAMLDHDGDGWLDLYFATNRKLPLDAPDDSMGNRLYRNRHDGTFEDATDRAGVGFRGFCHGLAVADFDNDGHPDLYLTNLSSNVLYRNRGDGTFEDVTTHAGLASTGWSTGAAFLDYDGDGRLDLYVSHYGAWSATEPRPYCGDRARNLRTICSPLTIRPAAHALYRNLGDGRFREVTREAGLGRNDGRGLGVVAADLNRDGRIDLYVANDKCPNFLFLNRGDGTFEDATETSGAAGNEAGEFQGSMGADAQDVDGDGWPELAVTNFRGEGVTLYRNLKGGNFQDVSPSAGILAASKPYVGWAVGLLDLDGDTRLDLLAFNGHVDDNLEKFGQDIPQAEPSTIWRPRGTPGRLAFDLAAAAGPFFEARHVARGAAFGDLDNDGDLDAAVSLLDARPAILLNESRSRPWIRLALVGRASNRSAIGAAVELHSGGRTQTRQVIGGGGYLSASDSRVLFGLGDRNEVDRVVIRWPSGRRTELVSPASGRTHTVVEPEASR